MRIHSISLEQFRSFPAFAFEIAEPNVHVLLGPNGAGKTNILESISVLSLTKSFLPVEELDIVQWGKEYYRIKAELENDHGEKSTVEVTSQILPRKQKACFINDVKKSLSDMVGHLPTVAFLPQDLELFTGPPAQRRRFLDILLCQVSPEYSSAMSQYLKILKQRNALLKKIVEGVAKRADLEHWDILLSQAAAVITLKRLEIMEVFQCSLTQEIQSLGEKWKEAILVYQRKGEARTQVEIAKEMQELLAHYQERDLILQSTTVGPHRDDWRIDIDGRSLTTFASRGQQRAAVLALLFLKVSFLELRRGEKPVVLLDDVFSELDDNHQSALLRCFDDYQVIISATHVPKELEGAKVWEMNAVVSGK
ncbi:MAG: DNA replication/repair protein RecF [Kiritimatiellales bacterium]|nr:DNA replication/repair protein RecF [Kiritimatiellales bacterium]